MTCRMVAQSCVCQAVVAGVRGIHNNSAVDSLSL